MRVLWFAVTPSLFGKSSLSHNGGGWIESLERYISQEKNVELGVAFEYNIDIFKETKNNTTYYPINIQKSIIDRIKRKLLFKFEEKKIIEKSLKIIADYNPDIIHIFGSEWSFGLLSYYTKIPIVIHMQGSIPPYYNARYPPGYSRCDKILDNKFKILSTLKFLKSEHYFYERARREERILKNCFYFLGRTTWDYNITRLYSPDSSYYYCSEVLRENFYLKSDVLRDDTKRDKFKIVSTISKPLYKGVDLVLKTAKILVEIVKLDFEWNIIGIEDISYHERKTLTKSKNFNVNIKGVLTSLELEKELSESDIYVHPSYIDNSPNSLCEAQILGLPVIAVNVGGTSSLIEHDKNGFLCSANDPYSLSYYIKYLYDNTEIRKQFSINSRTEAIKRHNPQRIVSDLLKAYKSIKLNDDKDVPL